MRRRVASAVVVAAVAAVAVASIVDSVRPRAAPALDAEAAAQLAELGVAGTLIYTDTDCALHALSLPDLRPAAVPEGPDIGCGISVSPGGRHVAADRARWSSDGSQYAICRGSRVDLVPGGQAYDGCAPAWRPDGMLTFARDGAIRQARFERILVPRRELVRAVRAHPNAPAALRIDELRVLDLAWTSSTEVYALVEAHYRLGLPEFQTTVAAFESGRLAWQRSYFGRRERLVISSAGDLLFEPAVRTESPLFAGLDPSGPIDPAPRGSRVAVATRASVFVVDPVAQRRIRIPVTARDLAWR